MLAKSFHSAGLAALFLLAACAGTTTGAFHDPYEPANRRVHAFNKGVDRALLRPLTAPLKGDGDGEPNGALIMIGRIGDNLSLPGKVVNSVLQGRPDDAMQNAGRFAINSTLGLGGLHDPAGQEMGLTEIDTDFGETLHVWGVPEGAYLELPLLGPSTERDFAGKLVDWVIDPLGGVLNEDQARGARAITVISKAGERARFGGTIDSILHESADSYAQARLLYLQHRRFELGEEGGAIDPYDE